EHVHAVPGERRETGDADRVLDPHDLRDVAEFVVHRLHHVAVLGHLVDETELDRVVVAEVVDAVDVRALQLEHEDVGLLLLRVLDELLEDRLGDVGAHLPDEREDVDLR
ncbi:MAG: hypothetical protein ACK559_38640, partial [bacterium]